ncbi:hypothetical protein BDN72DRAFT_959054 [Pluteus cervinus]|uniref:Uncharacterized protein n=1 Tax=Pluteus cervinus TaxID=181527 RepID=A0ACD3AX70_9AGAR|nr:hypothetical protein BDN72DRAFT_959054 [Pluteus cervinus]
MPPPTLPTEIISEIFSWINTSFIGSDRLKTLISCCLASSSWRTLAQPLLLSRVMIKIGAPRSQKIATAIQTFPRFKTHVDRLWVNVGFPAGSIQELGSLADTGPWQLKGFRLWVEDSGIQDHYRRSIPFRSAFDLLISSDRLTSLSLCGLTLSSSVLLSVPATLAELELADVSFHDMQLSSTSTAAAPAFGLGKPQKLESSTDSPAPRPCIRKLCVVTSHGLLAWFVQPHCPLDFSQLETLSLSRGPDENAYTPEGFEPIRAFLDLVAPTIKHLSYGLLTRDFSILNGPSPFPFDKMKRLQTLSPVLGTRNGPYEFSWIRDFLANVPQLKVICVYGNLHTHVSNPVNVAGWHKLDDELGVLYTGVGVYFSPLVRYILDWREKQRNGHLAKFLKNVPKLREQGRITVYPSFGPGCPVEDDFQVLLSLTGTSHIPVTSFHAQEVHQVLWRYALDI